MSKFTVAHRFGFIELKKESLVFTIKQGIFIFISISSPPISSSDKPNGKLVVKR